MSYRPAPLPPPSIRRRAEVGVRFYEEYFKVTCLSSLPWSLSPGDTADGGASGSPTPPADLIERIWGWG